jgi:hypothetical protein
MIKKVIKIREMIVRMKVMNKYYITSVLIIFYEGGADLEEITLL